MRMPLKKQYPSLSNILLFVLVYGFGVFLTAFILLPSTSRPPVVVNKAALTGVYAAAFLVSLVNFLLAWLRDPGYVVKRPNPDFIVPLPTLLELGAGDGPVVGVSGLRVGEVAAQSALQRVQQVRGTLRPPLSLDQQLRGSTQPRPLLCLHHPRPPPTPLRLRLHRHK